MQMVIKYLNYTDVPCLQNTEFGGWVRSCHYGNWVDKCQVAWLWKHVAVLLQMCPTPHAIPPQTRICRPSFYSQQQHCNMQLNSCKATVDSSFYLLNVATERTLHLRYQQPITGPFLFARYGFAGRLIHRGNFNSSHNILCTHFTTYSQVQ